MNVLITGVAGFIGSALAQSAISKGYRVHGLDCFLPDLYGNDVKESRVKFLRTKPSFTFIERDLRLDLSSLDISEVDLVIHCAAMAGLSQSWTNFRTYQDCNLLSTFNLVAHLSQYPRVKLIHASTSSVYGKFAVGDESLSTKPVSPYGVTKFAAEQVVQNYVDSHGISANILRLFSVYGPNQRPDMAYSKFISQLYSGQELEIYGDGQQVRSNTYIDDVVEAFWSVQESDKVGETFNVSGFESRKLQEFIDLASSLLNVVPKVRFLPSRVGDQLTTIGDSRKLNLLTGWRAKVNFTDGVRSQINAFLENL